MLTLYFYILYIERKKAEFEIKRIASNSIESRFKRKLIEQNEVRKIYIQFPSAGSRRLIQTTITQRCCWMYFSYGIKVLPIFGSSEWKHISRAACSDDSNNDDDIVVVENSTNIVNHDDDEKKKKRKKYHAYVHTYIWNSMTMK